MFTRSFWACFFGGGLYPSLSLFFSSSPCYLFSVFKPLPILAFDPRCTKVCCWFFSWHILGKWWVLGRKFAQLPNCESGKTKLRGAEEFAKWVGNVQEKNNSYYERWKMTQVANYAQYYIFKSLLGILWKCAKICQVSPLLAFFARISS